MQTEHFCFYLVSASEFRVKFRASNAGLSPVPGFIQRRFPYYRFFSCVGGFLCNVFVIVCSSCLLLFVPRFAVLCEVLFSGYLHF